MRVQRARRHCTIEHNEWFTINWFASKIFLFPSMNTAQCARCFEVWLEFPPEKKCERASISTYHLGTLYFFVVEFKIQAICIVCKCFSAFSICIYFVCDNFVYLQLYAVRFWMMNCALMHDGLALWEKSCIINGHRFSLSRRWNERWHAEIKGGPEPTQN